jgi:glycosyltransferase involved in cell wall biosynthesis
MSEPAAGSPQASLPEVDRRPRVLVFAYACEPDRGSEPGAGWGLVRAISEFADCVVLVGPEHGPGLRRHQELHEVRGVTFIVVPEPVGAASAKRHRITWFLLYLAWLRRADAIGRRLHEAAPFDATCHATYSTYWLPSPATRYGVPCVWGPVGGAVVTPLRLWPALGLRGIGDELLDLTLVNLLSRLPATRRTWRDATVRLVQNETTLARLPDSSGAIVLNHALFTQVPSTKRRPQKGVCLFLGSLSSRKGPRLAVRALACTSPEIRLVLLGSGGERSALERLARKLGVSDRVTFEGQLPRREVFARLSEAAVALFTGLREEGGIALAEALLLGVPVVVLSHGGARTIAANATDPRRVAMVQPGSVRTTARALGEAMVRLARLTEGSTGPLLDQSRPRQLLRTAFGQAIGATAALAPDPAALD